MALLVLLDLKVFGFAGSRCNLGKPIGIPGLWIKA
jgi:hypothetical protein